ncbi:MgtC/SapB family protein [Thiomonas bhubaneswarensis]|uniref:Uncharacterized membrane protein, DUF4010 family n=1 Tax=Thiomonas bhubaneswarensis TaxID=339866 RepID=A0A0K6HW31_9BURK|nr:DUF4010 domain-containing protein [Thiomonas bhubaneswarensis]CUA95080.1 Uncharacterized membrane protein, DUF4010 family [Thiomonas bhubaneswarensis]
MLMSSALPWLAALGAGLLIGIERERSQPQDAPAGLRSFVLAALSGAAAAAVGPLALALTLAAFAVLTLAGYLQTRSADPGLTTEFALILTVLLGALAQQSAGLAAGLAVLTAGILAAKALLHRLVRTVLSQQEMESGLLLFAAALVVLPLLPDQPIAWLAGLNLHTLWLLAVLVMGIQTLGHIGVRVLGARRGLALSGLAGGFVSSTATIASMAQRARATPSLRGSCLQAAFLSNLATAIELGALIGVIAPDLLPGLLPALGLYGFGSLLGVGLLLRRASPADAGEPLPASQRPFQPLQAIVFAAILAVVLLVAEAARGLFGGVGAVVATGMAGFADAHAASASAAQLAVNGAFTPEQALSAIGLAVSANAVSKSAAGFAGAQRAFGQSNLVMQVALIGLFWLGLWVSMLSGRWAFA